MKKTWITITILAAAMTLDAAPASAQLDSRSTALAALMAQAGAVELPLVATVPVVTANDQTGRDDKDWARFEFLKNRLMEKQGLPPEAGETPDQSKWGPAPAPWKELEAGRAAVFDRRFGPGAYDAVIRFSGACRNANGCKILLTADLISGAYGFIALEKDAASGALIRGSQAYRERDEKLKTEMRAAVEAFRPKAGASKEYTESFDAFALPILNNL